MPITDKEKEQVLAIINKMDGMELVRFGGMVYDGLIALKNQIGIQKTIVLGKYISANVSWTSLTTLFPGEKEQKSMQELRLNVLRSAEEHILRKIVDIFTIVADETVPEKTETPSDASPPPAQAAAVPDKDDPTTHMESVPGGDTELPPAGGNGTAETASEPVTAAPATPAAPDDLDMLGDDDEDPLAGIEDEEDDQETEAPDQEASASTESQPATEPVPPTEPAPAKPAETTP